MTCASCRLCPSPVARAGYLFEEKSSVIGGRTGYADVFKAGAFAWENKAPGKNLDAALKQLLSYSLALSNPPILVVCDRLTIRIHTQFTGHPTETFNVPLHALDQPASQALLRRIWLDPESFRPQKASRDITELAARSFATLAEGLRKRGPAKDADPQAWQTQADEVAHFLTQCLFCFFAEDVGLLPGRMFEGLVNNRKLTSDKLTGGMRNLFAVMRDGGLYGNDDIPWFNGGLFKKISVPVLTVLDMTELRNAAALNWSAIDVSIFGTLFERGLDPDKRSQLGAHYTDPATIQRIFEPVLKRQLLQLWEQTAAAVKGLLAKSTRKGDKNHKAAQACFFAWLDQLKNYRVLDPACGSGNFLFLGLKALKDIEHQSHIEAAALGLDREADLVTGPHNMLGIELNEYAAELARVTVWIGELQWRLLHGYEFKTNPVLEPLDHIECRDALLALPPLPLGEGRGEGSPRAIEAAWPKASVVIGNPAMNGLDRYIVTPRVAKHRFFVWMSKAVLPDSRLNSIVRADDTTFGLLSSRIHEVWSLAQASMHGVGNDPTYNAKSCFETFPFPEGLTPADTAHQRTEAVAGGALIPAGISESNKALAHTERLSVATEHIANRVVAESIAVAAKRLSDLREAWLNPPEWTQRVPEVVPLGMETSPYPDRILPKLGHEKELAERTLTKLYNQRPAWLDAAHKTLDLAVAAAYGWADYSPETPDEEILKRLLALNLARSGDERA